MSTSRPPLPQAQPVPVVAGQSPKGMIQAETAIFNAWLADEGRFYDEVTYNLRVGKGADPGPTSDDAMRRMAIMNSQRRVDALMSKDGHLTIVEVKVRGSLWAIGQLLGYRLLYLQQYPLVAPPDLLMLCGSIDEDTAYCCTQLGVVYQVVLVPAAE